MAALNTKTEIFTVKPLSTVDIEPSVHRTDRKEKAIRTLDSCKGKNVHQNRRKEMVLFVPDNDDSKFIDAFYGPLVLLIIITSPFSITLLPMNNVFIQPKYWYELPISTISLTGFFSTALVAMKPLFECDFNKTTMKAILDLFIVIKMAEALVICLIHLIWSDVLWYYEPFPFRLTLSLIPGFILLPIRLWHLIPKQMHIDPLFRKRFKWILLILVWITSMSMQLYFIRNVMPRISREFQWILALVAPVIKEINDRINDKIMTIFVTPENTDEAKFIGKIRINLKYSFWLAVSFIGVTEASTEYVLLAINFCVNLSLCYKVIRLNRKILNDDGDLMKMQKLKKEVLTELILNESIEVIVPISFIGAFSLAYYGPNKDLLLIVREIKTLPIFLAPVVKMALIDSGSLILAGAALLWFCRINILKEYCKTMKKYWIYLASFGGLDMCQVSNMKIEMWYRSEFI